MAGSTTANGWTYIPNGAPVDISQIFTTFGGGHALFYALSVSGTNTTLGATRVTYTSQSLEYSMTFDEAGVSYTMQGWGVTSNGTILTAGNANTPVDSIFVCGASTTIMIGNTPIEQARQQWAGFYDGVRYSGNWGEVSMDTVYAAPEPSSGALLVIGLGALGVIRRKKHQP